MGNVAKLNVSSGKFGQGELVTAAAHGQDVVDKLVADGVAEEYQTVTLVVRQSPYNAGETISVPMARAKQLLAKKYAMPTEAYATKEAKPQVRK